MDSTHPHCYSYVCLFLCFMQQIADKSRLRHGQSSGQPPVTLIHKLIEERKLKPNLKTIALKRSKATSSGIKEKNLNEKRG